MSAPDQARARADALLRPIAGDRRAGVDARGDARAELLRDEMRKDEYLRRDWPAIADAAAGLLADLSKDFVVATCWASAAYETDGLSGLAAGLSLLQGLLEQYWEDMFPPPARIRQRDNALANFYEHVAVRLQAVKTDPKHDTGAAPLSLITADHEPDLAACAVLLDALHAAAQTRFTPPPNPRDLRAQLARLQAALPKPSQPAPPADNPPRSDGAPHRVTGSNASPSHPESAPTVDTTPARVGAPSDTAPRETATTGSVPVAHRDPDAAAEPSPRPGQPRRDHPAAAPGAQTARPPAATPKPLHDPGSDTEPLDAPPRSPPNAADVPAYLNAVTPNLLRAAHALRRQQPGDPLAYRLLRAAVWLRAVAPVADAQGRVPLDPLPPGVRNQCESMLRSGKWPELLDTAESAFAAPPHRFCLDLHRYSATALERLGHLPARTALLAELAALLHRMPGLLDLPARDGTPLADPDTRALLVAKDMSPGPSLPALAKDMSPGTSPTAPALTVMSHEPAPMSSGTAHLAPATAALAPLSSGPAISAHPTAPTLTHPPATLASLSSGPAALGPADAADLSAALTAARARLAARDLPGALAGLQHHASVAASPRARFEARLVLAHLTLEAGLVPVARAQTTALLREADERRLADWEPQLVARVLDLHVTALRAAPRPPDGPDLQRHFDHLSVLDPAAAARQSAHART